MQLGTKKCDTAYCVALNRPEWSKAKGNWILHFSSRYILGVGPAHPVALVTSPHLSVVKHSIVAHVAHSTSNHSPTSWRRANKALVVWSNQLDRSCRGCICITRRSLQSSVIRRNAGCDSHLPHPNKVRWVPHISECVTFNGTRRLTERDMGESSMYIWRT